MLGDSCRSGGCHDRTSAVRSGELTWAIRLYSTATLMLSAVSRLLVWEQNASGGVLERETIKNGSSPGAVVNSFVRYETPCHARTQVALEIEDVVNAEAWWTGSFVASSLRWLPKGRAGAKVRLRGRSLYV